MRRLFKGNRDHSLILAGMQSVLHYKVFEKGAQSTEANISGGDRALSGFLYVGQERKRVFRAQIIKR
jgi:hypothetical protein